MDIKDAKVIIEQDGRRYEYPVKEGTIKIDIDTQKEQGDDGWIEHTIIGKSIIIEGQIKMPEK